MLSHKGNYCLQGFEARFGGLKGGVDVVDGQIMVSGTAFAGEPKTGLSPARDLFDVGQNTTPEAQAPYDVAALTRAGPSFGVSVSRIAKRLMFLGTAGAVLQFPSWIVMALLCAAVPGEILVPWRRISRLYWTALLAVVSAQATSLFVTPFTWPMRFGFFFTLIGSWVVFYAIQTDDVF
jgi:hypothetical protein